MPPVIQIQNLSKMYRLGTVGSGTLRDDFARVWARLRGQEDPFAKVGQVNRREQAGGDYVWALKDVNLEVEEGEVLGIIGRNGAGKSTLLKLLSRVTAPTEGCLRVRGRIASLLEVGTGFHPELTGRENVYLNGSLLGMSRREVSSRLDEIVEFSGCAKYIDTPVKRYSSGMLVRLGFAVAAHLVCEILIVDEVLAVGDAEFQKKCIGKMGEFAAGGRTVLLVTHQLAVVESLATQVAVIANGSLAFQGPTKRGIAFYSLDHARTGSIWEAGVPSPFRDSFVPRRLWVAGEGEAPLEGPHPVNRSLDVIIEGDVLESDPQMVVGFALYNGMDETLFRAYHTDAGAEAQLPVGHYRFRSRIPAYLLNEGEYRLELIAGIHPVRWVLAPHSTPATIRFEVRGGLDSSSHWTQKRPGELAVLLPFHVEPVSTPRAEPAGASR